MAKEAVVELPQEAKLYLDKLLEMSFEKEKKEYHNDLVPFSQHAKTIRETTYKQASALYQKLNRAEKILQNHLEKDEKTIPEEARFRHSMDALSKLRDQSHIFESLPEEAIMNLAPLQELAGIGWGFMDRAYNVAKELMKEKQLEDAATLFFFLRYLHPLVFEYWFCEGACLQELGNLEEAYICYRMSLLSQPENPYAYFQIAKLFVQMGEKESVQALLDRCLECSLDNQADKELYQEAKSLKQSLQ